MTSNTHTDDRAALVAGLRGLADFLEANPAVPVPPSWSSNQCISVLPPSGPNLTDNERRAFVDRFAASLGIEASDPDASGHYRASRKFGPLIFESFAISTEAMDAHHARASYADVIRLNEGPVAA